MTKEALISICLTAAAILVAINGSALAGFWRLREKFTNITLLLKQNAIDQQIIELSQRIRTPKDLTSENRRKLRKLLDTREDVGGRKIKIAYYFGIILPIAILIVGIYLIVHVYQTNGDIGILLYYLLGSAGVGIPSILLCFSYIAESESSLRNLLTSRIEE